MDAEHDLNASRALRWRARVATTLIAWLAAFLVVTLLQRLFGDQLGSLPLELRALVLSGVLVGLMANVVMPAVSSVVVGAAGPAGSPDGPMADDPPRARILWDLDVPQRPGQIAETLRMVPAGRRITSADWRPFPKGDQK